MNVKMESTQTKGNHKAYTYSPKQSLSVSDDEPDPISMAEVTQPPLLLEARLSQHDNLVLLHDILREATGKNLNSNIAVELGQARVTHFSTVLTNVRFSEEELKK